MTEKATPHSEHEPQKKPVEGCEECDRAVNRPVRRSFGEGYSSVVIPRPEPKDKEPT